MTALARPWGDELPTEPEPWGSSWVLPPPGWMMLSLSTGSGSKATPAIPPRAPTATVAAVIRPMTLSRLLLKYSPLSLTGGGRGCDRSGRGLLGRRGRLAHATPPAVGADVGVPAPIAPRACLELERTEVPQTMQKAALTGSRFSHSGQ